MIEIFLPAPTYKWRETKKTHKGKCPKRGHCRRDRESRMLQGKGNSSYKIIHKGLNPKTRKPNLSIGLTERAQAAQDAIVAGLIALPERPEVATACDVRLDATFVFEPVESWPAWKKEAALAQHIRPTFHNVGDRGQHLKMIEDCLEKAGYYANDRQVTVGDVSKIYGLHQGYSIRITRLRPTPRTKKDLFRLLNDS